jgi:hypothetical protein
MFPRGLGEGMLMKVLPCIGSNNQGEENLYQNILLWLGTGVSSKGPCVKALVLNFEIVRSNGSFKGWGLVLDFFVTGLRGDLEEDCGILVSFILSLYFLPTMR